MRDYNYPVEVKCAEALEAREKKIEELYWALRRSEETLAQVYARLEHIRGSRTLEAVHAIVDDAINYLIKVS
jgi:prefoldin subunit 5